MPCTVPDVFSLHSVTLCPQILFSLAFVQEGEMRVVAGVRLSDFLALGTRGRRVLDGASPGTRGRRGARR